MEDYKFFYGDGKTMDDITKDVQLFCTFKDENSIKVFIPESDELRAAMFGDPLYGTLKHISVSYKNNPNTKLFAHNEPVKLIIIINEKIPPMCCRPISVQNKIANIHEKMAKDEFYGGSLLEEYPEQLMSARFLNKNSKVLEIGANIGRNTAVIASMLENPGKQFVTLECDPKSCAILRDNQCRMQLDFNIVNAALSYRRMFQKGWSTLSLQKEQDEAKIEALKKEGWFEVNTITFEKIEDDFDIKFDTLVLDCEGSFYQILLDNEKILDYIKLILVENDYDSLQKKETVDRIIKKRGFQRIYVKKGFWHDNWTYFTNWKHSADCLYEVWAKI